MLTQKKFKEVKNMINWTVRFKNKTWLLTMAGVLIAFVYQVAGLLGFVPPIAQDQVVQLIGIVVNMLVAIGVVQDPTTAGISDSTRALQYNQPNKG